MPPRIQHLNSLDATFLHIESAEMPMHVASLDLLELPAGYAGDFYEDAKAHIASRMHLAPLFTRKLALMPFELSNPVWVEDEDIDLDYHVRRVQLPKPGSWEQLERYVARLHSSLLDRSRPLWEFTIFEGLDSGHVAMYAKVHHAGVDGGGAVALAGAILDTMPEGRPIKKARLRPRTNQYQLGIAELAGAAASNTLRQAVTFAKALPTLARAVRDIVGNARHSDASLLDTVRGAIAPRTPYNVAITNQRSWAARQVALADTKMVAKATGATLNDVVLSVCAGAMRRHLADYDATPTKPMTVAVPVSLREAGDTSADNQVSMMLMQLASDIRDPLERLKAIAEASKKTKATMGAATASVPLDFPLPGAPWLISGAASFYGRSRLANVVPPVANVLISNVPGPNVPLYFAGAKMLSFYPVSIPVHGMALNITVQSYNGSLFYGLIACRRAVPDVNDLADYVVQEHQRLMQLVLAAQADAKPDTTASPQGPETANAAATAATRPATKTSRKTAPKRRLELVRDTAKAAAAAAAVVATSPARAIRKKVAVRP
jgi:diacylglycerol O-acyltransferase / wax synthase